MKKIILLGLFGLLVSCSNVQNSEYEGNLEIAKELQIEIAEWQEIKSVCSGPPLEINEHAKPTESLEPEEIDFGLQYQGYAMEAWLLFYLPVWLGRFWLSVVFGWLPHHPHVEVGRYRDTRVFTFFASTFLIRGHDYHLLHHLFPRVPHYRLRSVWREIGPHLVAQGARIEGKAARELGIAPQ